MWIFHRMIQPMRYLMYQQYGYYMTLRLYLIKIPELGLQWISVGEVHRIPARYSLNAGVPVA